MSMIKKILLSISICSFLVGCSTPTTSTSSSTNDDVPIITLNEDEVDTSYAIDMGDSPDDIPWTTKTGMVAYYFSGNIQSITDKENNEYVWVEELPDENNENWYYLDVSNLFDGGDEGLNIGSHIVTVIACNKKGNKAQTSFIVNVHE